MIRNVAREIAVHLSYELSFSELGVSELLDQRLSEEGFAALAEEDELYCSAPNEKQARYIRTLVAGVDEHAAELDSYIEKYAVGWNIARISRISKCILRLSMYEVLYMQIPVGASVNEALELVKQYDSEEAAGFVNGIMGAFVAKELQA